MMKLVEINNKNRNVDFNQKNNMENKNIEILARPSDESMLNYIPVRVAMHLTKVSVVCKGINGEEKGLTSREQNRHDSYNQA